MSKFGKTAQLSFWLSPWDTTTLDVVGRVVEIVDIFRRIFRTMEEQLGGGGSSGGTWSGDSFAFLPCQWAWNYFKLYTATRTCPESRVVAPSF